MNAQYGQLNDIYGIMYEHSGAGQWPLTSTMDLYDISIQLVSRQCFTQEFSYILTLKPRDYVLYLILKELPIIIIYGCNTKL